MSQSPRSPQWEDLAAQVLHLTYSCPFDGRNPTFCPLFKIRSDSVKERVKWVKGLKLEQLKEMASRHEICLQLKRSRSEGP